MRTSRRRRPGGRAWGAVVLLLLGTLLAGAAVEAQPSAADLPAEAAPRPPAGVLQAESPSQLDRPQLLGMSLTEALLTLQALGLKLVFTSQLVLPDMRVLSEPLASEPRRILDELLAPHGLAAQEGAGGAVVVVRAAAPRSAGGSIAGIVRAHASGQALAGARVRVVELGVEVGSDEAGRFEIEGLAPGVYTLEAELHDYLVAEARGVVVGADRPAVVVLALQPVPFIREEILVRSSQLSLFEEEPAAPLSLSREDIESLPHLAGDLFRALSLLPGTTANDVTAQFNVHGGRRDEVQVLLDGQELYEAYHLQDYDRAVSVVAPGGLAEAKLSTGAFAANYGDRMSGVLDMTTTVPSGPRRTRLSLSLVSAVAGSGGSFGGERGSWLASGRRGSIDLANRLFGREDPAFWDLFGKVGYRLGEGQHAWAHLLHADDTLEFQEESNGERKLFDTDYDSSYLWLTHQATLGGRVLVESTASTTRLDRDRRGAETEQEVSFEVLDRRTFDVVGGAQSWSFEGPGRHSLRAGFEARRYEARYDYFNLLEPDLVLSTDLAEPRMGITAFAGRFTGDHLGAHAADRFSPLPPLTVELGLRYDRHTLTRDTLWSPRVNLAWRLSEASVLRASWGHFHQSQRPYELQVEDGETRFFPAERSVHWVVGYERLLGRHERSPLSALRVEAYRREIGDPRPRFENIFEPVNTFPETEHDRLRIAPEESLAQGIEVTLRGSAGSRTDWWVNYAYASAEDRLRGEEVPRQTDQRHAANLYVATRLSGSWDLSLAWRFHTGWPTTPVSLSTLEDEEGEVELVPLLGRLNSERLPSYHRLDVRASRHWERRAGRFVFFVDLQNVYNRKNTAGFDLEIDEEEGRLIKEEEAWPGFFPSVGITWEF